MALQLPLLVQHPQPRNDGVERRHLTNVVLAAFDVERGGLQVHHQGLYQEDETSNLRGQITLHDSIWTTWEASKGEAPGWVALKLRTAWASLRTQPLSFRTAPVQLGTHHGSKTNLGDPTPKLSNRAMHPP